MAAFRRFAQTTTLFGAVRSAPQKETLPSPLPTNHIARRGYHIDLGAREKALLEEDPALKKFKSYKNNLKRVSKIGDVLTIVVVAACAYELYAVATVRKEQRH
ncbi:succinate dehydrogenase subunit 7, mitochondrial-like isoform X1 [Zingiber officinale]|uniref:succinate dehydrogenase subunit 7, mitochondrial-like isoform X1 n=1 Tax=Zingiber officinale TaxID=94328 RepID=UPI001C4BBD88|nr:succinate dehydrogenase subunit 7, mitochondrial-like isoform X1 [Zingiber officinale]